MCILIYTQGPENESRIWTNTGYNALIVSLEALSIKRMHIALNFVTCYINTKFAFET